jgi:hypothetical protein
MAADNVTSIQQMQDQVRVGYADLTALYKGNIEALMASSQALIGGCQAVTAALLAFMQSRAKEGLSTGKRLAECGSPEHAAEIQLDFARATLRAYTDQFNTLGEMTKQVLTESYGPFERQVAAVAKSAADSVAA